MTEQPGFIVLGTGGIFTLQVIRTLIEQRYFPLAYIQSGAKPARQKTCFADIELEVKPSCNDLSQRLKTRSIPFYYQSPGDLANRIQHLKADFLLVACWPELLSRQVIDSVSTAALNLHPSLLPEFRGGDPVRAQIAAKDNNFGVTLHLLNEQFDAGDIVYQQRLNLQSNPDPAHVEIHAATSGAQLFIQALTTHKTPGWCLIEQKNLETSYS